MPVVELVQEHAERVAHVGARGRVSDAVERERERGVEGVADDVEVRVERADRAVRDQHRRLARARVDRRAERQLARRRDELLARDDERRRRRRAAGREVDEQRREVPSAAVGLDDVRDGGRVEATRARECALDDLALRDPRGDALAEEPRALSGAQRQRDERGARRHAGARQDGEREIRVA